MNVQSEKKFHPLSFQLRSSRPIQMILVMFRAIPERVVMMNMAMMPGSMRINP